MLFVLAIDKTNSGSYGVVIPSLPGCYSGSDESFEDAIKCARNAIELHLSEINKNDDAERYIKNVSIEETSNDPDYAGCVFVCIDVNVDEILGDPITITMTIQPRYLRKIDEYRKKRSETRSGFMTRCCLEIIDKE